jgi:hypothetical protein
MYADNKVLYPKDLPKHHAVGKVFYAYDGQVYYCDSYDPRVDYWMTNVIDASDRKPVSPRAINGTFHDAGDSWKPRCEDDVVGRTFYMVDLRAPHDQFTIVVMAEKDCLALDDRQILFFYEDLAQKFIRKVNEAVFKREAEKAAKAAQAASWASAS